MLFWQSWLCVGFHFLYKVAGPKRVLLKNSNNFNCGDTYSGRFCLWRMLFLAQHLRTFMVAYASQTFWRRNISLLRESYRRACPGCPATGGYGERYRGFCCTDCKTTDWIDWPMEKRRTSSLWLLTLDSESRATKIRVVTWQNLFEDWFFRNSWILAALKLSPCAVGVEFATVVVSYCTLPIRVCP